MRDPNPQIGFQLHPVKRNPDSKALSGFRFTRPGRPAEWSGMEYRGTGLGRRRPKLKKCKMLLIQ